MTTARTYILACCFWLDSRYSFRCCHQQDSYFHRSWQNSLEFATSVVSNNRHRLLAEYIYHLILQ